MNRIPFDRDAVALTRGQARQPLRTGGLTCYGPTSCSFSRGCCD